MSNKRMVPEVRFKGYDDSWAKSKILDCISKGASGNTPNTKNRTFYEGDIPFLNISDITSNSNIIYDTEKHITREAVNSCTWIVPSNSISLAMYASVGKVCILMNDMTTSQAMFNMILKENHSPYFMLQNFELINYKNKWIELISTGTQPNLNAEKIQNFELHYPAYQEQSKIGEFFKNIDNLITQTTTNLDKLKDVKKSLLNKMFPCEGKLVPEIRFSQFNDLWKVVKLNEISRYTISNLNVSDANYNGKYALYDALCKIGYTDKMAINKPYITIIKDGAGIGRVRVLPENTMFIGTMGAIHNNQEVNINFLYHIMSKFDFSISSIGTAIPHIYWSDYSENLVKISELVEQSKIAEFLTAVDKLITLTNKKLTKLKEIKKALLQKMFV